MDPASTVVRFLVALAPLACAPEPGADSCQPAREAIVPLDVLRDTADTGIPDGCPTMSTPGLEDALRSTDPDGCTLERVELLNYTSESCTYEYWCVTSCAPP